MTNTTTTENQSRAGQATDKAMEVAGSAREHASAVTSTAKDEAASVMNDARAQGRRLAGESRDQLRQKADEQGRRLAGTLRDLGGQLHGMATGTTTPTGMLADVTKQAASSADQLADSLDVKGVHGVVDDVKQFARRRPGAFIVGAIAAGVVTGRLIRSLDTGAVVDAAKPATDPEPTQLPPTPMGMADLNRPKEF